MQKLLTKNLFTKDLFTGNVSMAYLTLQRKFKQDCQLSLADAMKKKHVSLDNSKFYILS